MKTQTRRLPRETRTAVRPAFTAVPDGRGDGFTLIELLMVIAIIAILATLLLPVLSRVKGKAQGIECMNHGQQMVKALHMYASDSEDWMPPNPEDGNPNAWVRGSMNNPLEATNTLFLTDSQWSKLARYAGYSAKIFKCPADKSTATIAGIKYPRVRTFSMSQAVGTKPTPPVAPVDGVWLDGTRHHVRDHPWRTYGRFADMVAPAPSGLWVFLDEDEHLINDGAFGVSMKEPTGIIDWPGTYHNFSAGFAFADGHSEIHKWLDERTRIPGNYRTDPADYMRHKTQPGNLDIMWLQQRTSANALPAAP